MVTRRGRGGYSHRPDLDLSSIPVHPILAAAYPVVFLFATNIADQVTLSPLWGPLGLAVGGSLVAAVIGRAVMGDWRRGALLASLVAILFFSFGHAWFLVAEVLHLRRYLIAAYAIVGLLAAWIIWRGGGWVVPTTRFLNVAFAALLLINAWNIGSHVARAADAQGSSAVPIAAEGVTGPDVYYIILDRYASAWTLEHVYGMDNAPFLADLRERGFHVADDAWANYFKTAFSITSSLDMAPLDGPALKAGAVEGQEFGPINARLRGHLAGPLTFKSLGYEYVHIASFWEPSTTNVDASVTFTYADGLEFSTALGETTALSLLEPAQPAATVRTIYTADLVRRFHAYGFQHLEESATRQGPTFAFAHILLPHPPYVYLPDGRSPGRGDGTHGRTVERQYADQVRYTNARVLEAIDKLIAAPGGDEAVIIIQADEGPFPEAFNADQRTFEWLGASNEEVVQKFGILNALRMPGIDPEAAGLTPRSSPVNNLRLVFNAYFDAGLELWPDDTFLSPDYARAYDFVRIERDADNMPIMPATGETGSSP